MYTYRSMLAEMNAGRPFTVRFITYDKRRQRGGQVRQVQAQVIEKPTASADQPPASAPSRSPGQARHTRRVVLLVDGHRTEQVRTLHIPLIVEFNGQAVMP